MGTDIHPYAEVWNGSAWKKADVLVPDDRNYWAFAKLAGVRNGLVGFAGVKMGEPIVPIAEPRGLPVDTSIANTEDDEYDDPGHVWLGDHSFSWVLLSELLEIDLDESIHEDGMISPEQDEKLKAGEIPESWCGWTSDKDWVIRSWTRPLGRAAPLLGKIIEALKPLGDPMHVRLVFGFDS